MYNNLSNYVLHCFWMVLVVVCITSTVFLLKKIWCPRMAIDLSVQHNGGLLLGSTVVVLYIHVPATVVDKVVAGASSKVFSKTVLQTHLDLVGIPQSGETRSKRLGGIKGTVPQQPNNRGSRRVQIFL